MKSAIIYYSLDGNTKFVAESLAKELHSDVFELKPNPPYPNGKVSKFFFGGKGSVFKEKPQLETLPFRVSDYDAVFIGTPLWAWNITPPIRTFLCENDLTKLAVGVFVCSGGGDPSKAFATIKNETKKSTLLFEQAFVSAKQNERETADKIAQICSVVSKYLQTE